MGHRLGTSLDAGRGREVEGVHRIAVSGEVGRRGGTAFDSVASRNGE